MRKFLVSAKFWIVHIPKIAGYVLDAIDGILKEVDMINYNKVKNHEIEMLKTLSTQEISTFNTMDLVNKTEMIKAFLAEQKPAEAVTEVEQQNNAV